MLTTSLNGRNLTLCPNGRNSTIVFHSSTSKSQLPGRTRILNIMVGPNFSPLWSDLNFNCLPQWQTTQLSPNFVQSQLPILFFKIFKFLGPSLPGMTSFKLQPHFLSGVYYHNSDCHILCARA